MRQTNAVALLIGLALTLVAAVVHWAGGWEALERQTIDWRFAKAPRPAQPLDRRIRFVDIDDGAIDSIGHWPWPRSVLADAIDELRRAGTKVVALDILFEEHQEPTILRLGDGPVVEIKNDQLLAEAFGRIPVVLASRVGEDEAFASAWSAGAGSPVKELLDRVTSNIQEDPAKAAGDLAIPADLRNELLGRPLQFKQVAIWRYLYSLLVKDQLPANLAELERLVAPHLEESKTGSYPEQRMLSQLWDQFQSWQILRQFALPGRTVRSSHVVAPLTMLAEKAAMTGVVNPELDQDGRQRQIKPVWPTPVGEVLQFGFAAAAAYEGTGLQQINVMPDSVTIGKRRWPLDEGQLWINWPTSGWSWEETSTDGISLQRVSIGALVSMAKMRRDQEGVEGEFQKVSREVAGLLGIPTPAEGMVSESVEKQVKDEVEFQLESFSELAKQSKPTKEEQDQIAPYEHWQKLQEAVARGREEIARRDQQLAGFKDSLVFVGWTATGALADFVGTPLGPRTPGVMVHVVVADMVLSGRSVTRLGSGAEAGLLAAMGLATALLVSQLSRGSALGMIAVLLAYFSLSLWMFSSHRVLLPLVGPMSSGALSWLGATTYVAAMNQRERQRITRQFKARVSSQLVDHLVHNPGSVSMAGEQREMTILFADLAGFTSIAEKLGGPATVATLNRYMGALTDVLIFRGAYLNKFLGDGLMAFWSAFAPDPNQAVLACEAAAECHREVERLNVGLEKEHGVRLSLRVGIATGTVVVGDCGAPPNLNDYTAIGDAVNLAARLESANKQFGTQVLIDHRTSEQAAAAGNSILSLGRVVVVGQSTPINVDAVLVEPLSDELRAKVDGAVAKFGASDRDGARLAWQAVLADAGATASLARAFLRAIDEAGDSFDGVLRMSMK